MIELYPQDGPPQALPDMISWARGVLRRGNAREATVHLTPALSQLHADEDDYQRLVALLTQCFGALGLPRQALTLTWYSGDTKTAGGLLAHVPAIDRARTLILAEGSRGAAAVHGDAATELEQAGFLARAAIQHERRGSSGAARTLWARLARLLESSPEQRYESGLAHFNVARTTDANDRRGLLDACVAAVHRLEEAADHFSAIGQRERAFDCYHVLVAIGRLSGSFEHVLEGAVNVVRILSEDNLERHAVRWYVHAIRMATGAGELVAAATLARDLAHYARRQGAQATLRAAALREAELWTRAAAALAQRGGSIKLVENALVAAAVAYAEVEHYREVANTFLELARLDLGKVKQETYRRAAARYVLAPESTTPPGLDTLSDGFAEPPPVWLDDLIEWENRGSAAEACADTLNDPELQNDLVTRRSALYSRLIALSVESSQGDEKQRGELILAAHLGSVGTYAMLSALEHLFRSEDADIRKASVASLSRYPYKRTFATLETAAEDPEPTVRNEAAAAIQRLRFDHAFDPLARIFRSSTNPAARLAALRSLCSLDLREAAELAIGILEHGNKAERAAVNAALDQQPPAALLEAARKRDPDGRRRAKRSARG